LDRSGVAELESGSLVGELIAAFSVRKGFLKIEFPGIFRPIFRPLKSGISAIFGVNKSAFMECASCRAFSTCASSEIRLLLLAGRTMGPQ
jgi:hypothetical protein